MSAFRVYAPEELGADGYPPEWHRTLKHVVRAEAGNRCLRCKHPYRNGEHGTGEWSPCDWECTHGYTSVFAKHPQSAQPDHREVQYPGRVMVTEARWRILTVHHLDGDKANCRWWNLAALCQRCHLTIQGRVVMDRPFHWEHSDWMKPYAAGFYAWKYLGEDLAREEVEARLEELLSLEGNSPRLPV